MKLNGGDAPLDWDLLKSLRTGYLGGKPGTALADYWRSDAALDHYDRTFGRRIAWKWDAVLDELLALGAAPTAGATLYDWGTGTGVAARIVVERYGAQHFRGARLFDRSERAVSYAQDALGAEAPGLPVSPWDPARGFDTKSPSLLLVSHVTTEMDSASLAALSALAARADDVIWVEPGTKAASEALVVARETLRPSHRILAPCPHQNRCGMQAAANARHWCHHFAKPPSDASQSAFWAEFSKIMGIDLRALPTSFIAARRGAAPDDLDGQDLRVIGRAREYNGYLKLLACGADGVFAATLQKRHDKARFKEVGRGSFTTLVPREAVEQTDSGRDDD